MSPSSLGRATAEVAMASGLLCMAPALAHVGHGDEFQQQGDVRQVESRGSDDALLGIITTTAQTSPDGITLPIEALVEANGSTLVFVKSGSTYDPVIVRTGETRAGRVLILSGITPGEEVVVQGALNLYGESKKTPEATPSPSTQTNENALRRIGLGALSLGVISAIGIGIVQGRRPSK